jgi:hypothetical protein
MLPSAAGHKLYWWISRHGILPKTKYNVDVTTGTGEH